jgi:hypothetical protein
VDVKRFWGSEQLGSMMEGTVRIAFDAGLHRCEFSFIPITGVTMLRVDGNPAKLERQGRGFVARMQLLQVYKGIVDSHKITIEVERAAVWADVRPRTFSVWVDDNLAASRSGY